MTEDEFRALLAIEGKELRVEASYLRAWDLDEKSMVRHTKAEIWEMDASGEYESMLMSTNWVQRRYYAVQSLIKRYYDD